MNHVLASLTVPGVDGSFGVPIQTAKPLFVFGRNGSGKSSLVHHMVQQLPRSIYIPGSRPSYFDNDSLQLTLANRRQMADSWTSWDRQPQTRYRPINGTQRNERAILDLQQVETQFKVDAANDISSLGVHSDAIERLQNQLSPFDRVNTLLRQANFPVSIVLEDGELVSRRDGTNYSIAKMSDGERTALILAAEVVCAQSGEIFVIDEPELHLHRSIVVPLIAALIAERTDCAFIISTHELELLRHYPHGHAIIVRGCRWSDDAVQSWQAHLLSELSRIPEDVRIDLLGSRAIIVFVEGESSSLDQPFYALLFPKASVVSRGSSREVKEAVRSLHELSALHHATAFGIIDNDHLDQKEIAELEAESIFALPHGTIESFYYGPECLQAVAKVQAKTFDLDAEQLADDARMAAVAVLANDASQSHLAARVAERQIRYRALSSLPDRARLKENEGDEIKVRFPSPYSEVKSRLLQIIEDKEFDAIVADYPIRESSFLEIVATTLKFRNTGDYESAVLSCVAVNEELRNKLRGKFGALTEKLG